LAYTTHPYRWRTIGKNLAHIEDAKLQDVKNFFFKHYNPSNAIMVVAGNIETEYVKQLTEKWFGPIPAGEKYNRNIPQEPEQTEARRKTVKAEVPLDAFYKCWHMPARMDKAYYAIDLITDILGGGASSRLYQKLVKEQQLFSNIDCYHYGSLDRGLLTIEGKLVKGITPEAAEAAVEKVLDSLRFSEVEEKELQKVKNKTESLMAFEDMGLMNRANSLAFYALIGDPNMMNSELEKYQAITVEDIHHECKTLFADQNSTTLYYLATQQQHEHN